MTIILLKACLVNYKTQTFSVPKCLIYPRVSISYKRQGQAYCSKRKWNIVSYLSCLCFVDCVEQHIHSLHTDILIIFREIPSCLDYLTFWLLFKLISGRVGEEVTAGWDRLTFVKKREQRTVLLRKYRNNQVKKQFSAQIPVSPTLFSRFFYSQ